MCPFDCSWLDFFFLSSEVCTILFSFVFFFLSSAATPWLVWPRTSKAESRRPHTASRGQANMFSFPQKYIFICSEIHLLFSTNPLMYHREGETTKRFVKFSTLGFVKVRQWILKLISTQTHTENLWFVFKCGAFTVQLSNFRMSNPPPHHPFFQNDT